MTRERAGLMAMLCLLGAGWGFTQPMGKLAVSSGHAPLGLIFWQLVIGVVVLSGVQALRRRALPLHPTALKWYLIIALIGTILPNGMSYIAIRHVPSGVMSIAIAAVPMFAFPIAIALGNDRFGWARAGGLVAGLCGVVLLIGPQSLPGVAWQYVLLALVAPFLYGIEGNLVAKFGAGGLGPVALLLGASLVGALISLPLALASGGFINPLEGIGMPEAALIASSVVHALVYTSYVWLVGRAGPTFAAQVSYLVTGFGILWAMALLGERYSGWVWAALALMFIGLFLVQPRPKQDLPGAG